MYNNNGTSDEGMKAFTYEQMINVCSENNCLEIIAQRAATIEQEAKDWKLTQAERRSLFKTVATALDKANYTTAYKVMVAYLNEFQSASDAEVATTEREANRCVFLGIKDPQVINFEELLDLKAVKQLQSKNTLLFDFLSLFAQSDVKTFKQQLGKFKGLMEQAGLAEEEVQLKKTYEQICSFQPRSFTYKELADTLDVSS